MRITCPTCEAGYDVAEDAIGAQGRKVRCRACGASWLEPPRAPVPPVPTAAAPELPTIARPEPAPVAPEPVTMAEPAPVTSRDAPIADTAPHRVRRHLRAPAIALLLVVVALALGIAIATVVWGPRQLASGLGLVDRRVPLGIAITKEPDWREIAGGSELFAVSGRVWNPTAVPQPVPDVRAEVKDKSGRTLRAWTIARPAKELAAGAHVDFDGAAIDVPRESAKVELSFVGEKQGSEKR